MTCKAFKALSFSVLVLGRNKSECPGGIGHVSLSGQRLATPRQLPDRSGALRGAPGRGSPAHRLHPAQPHDA